MKRYQIFCFYPGEGWMIQYSTDDRDDASDVYDELLDNHGSDGIVLADVLRASNAKDLQGN